MIIHNSFFFLSDAAVVHMNRPVRDLIRTGVKCTWAKVLGAGLLAYSILACTYMHKELCFSSCLLFVDPFNCTVRTTATSFIMILSVSYFIKIWHERWLDLALFPVRLFRSKKAFVHQQPFRKESTHGRFLRFFSTYISHLNPYR